MRLMKGFTAIILCFVLLGLVPLAGAEEAVGSDNGTAGENMNQLLSGVDTSSFNLEDLFSGDVLSGIVAFLISLFLSLFGISLS
jgi:hypothetical protein